MGFYFADKHILEALLEVNYCPSSVVLCPADNWEPILVHILEAFGVVGFTNQKKRELSGQTAVAKATVKTRSLIF